MVVPTGDLHCQCRGHRFGVERRDLEQGTGRPFRPPPALLPVLQRRDAHTDHERELRLRFAQLLADRLHVNRRVFRDPAGLGFSAADFARVFDARGLRCTLGARMGN